MKTVTISALVIAVCVGLGLLKLKLIPIGNIYAVECDTGFNTGSSKHVNIYEGIITWQPIETPNQYMKRKMHPGEVCYRYTVQNKGEQ